jgi:indole-3-glycerol phosphate synthase
VVQSGDFLQKIIRRKSERLSSLKQITSLADVRRAATELRQQAPTHALRQKLLKRDRLNVIAEFKRRSPSKGVIRADVDPVAIAESYETGGAAGISILTEEDHFDGSIQDLKRVKAASDLPVLRKDFIFDEYQIYESAAAGADAVLLIVAALADNSLSELRELVENQLGMDALVEVHDDAEMNRALAAGATLIGVNNRNLRTFEVSLEASAKLSHYAKPEILLVTESGLKTHADLLSLHALGYRGFLIGERLMRADNPGDALRAIIDGQVKHIDA